MGIEELLQKKNAEVEEEKERLNAVKVAAKDELDKNRSELEPVMKLIFKVFYECEKKIKKNSYECNIQQLHEQVSLNEVRKKSLVINPGKKAANPPFTIAPPYILCKASNDCRKIIFIQNCPKAAPKENIHELHEVTEELVEKYIEEFIENIL